MIKLVYLLLLFDFNVFKFLNSISIKSPAGVANQNDQPNQRLKQQQQHRQNQKTVKPSRSHSINMTIPKCLKQPAFGASQDKIKCELNNNNQEFDVTANNITPSIQRCPLNNRTVVDSANRTASGLM